MGSNLRSLNPYVNSDAEQIDNVVYYVYESLATRSVPHPENFVVGRQHPHHGQGGGRDHLGLAIFRNGVTAAKEM